MKRKIYRAILYIAILFFALWLIKTFLILPFALLDENMEPTLKKERLYFIDRLSYRFRNPRRGEVVILRTSQDPPLYFVKRVVGLAGERVKMERGVLFINDKLFNEPYAAVNSDWHFEEVLVGKGRVYVIDDNRTFGPGLYSYIKVSNRNIIGKLIGTR